MIDINNSLPRRTGMVAQIRVTFIGRFVVTAVNVVALMGGAAVARH
jgi:hypothetical protein